MLLLSCNVGSTAHLMDYAPAHLQFQVSQPRNRLRKEFDQIVLSNRFAICGALLFGIFIPELFHPFLSHSHGWAKAAFPGDTMLYVTGLALLLAHLSLRQTFTLPFVDGKVMILPVFVMTFASVALASGLLVSRTLTYYHLVTGFLGGSLWYLTLTLLTARISRQTVALIGVNTVSRDLLNSRITWVPWEHPLPTRSADAVVYDSNREYSPEWERFFARAVLRNIPVFDLNNFREMLIGRVQLRARPELVFGRLRPSQPYLRLKRGIDTFFALVVLGPALAVMGVAALLVRLESPGPVIFAQKRVGYQRRIFTCYKLRTMHVGVTGPLYTEQDDPRITRIGRFLRKWRIDELPQIFNVLKGEMSWIGPRPEALRLARSYERAIPFYKYRHIVRPGISGWAAVHQGNVALEDAATRKLEYDFYYIKYFSPWLDYVIALMTLRTIFNGVGSR